MAFKRVENRQKIMKIIDHLISSKTEVSVTVRNDNTVFTSRVINADQNYPSLAKGTKAIIILEKLLPEKGNDLIQASPHVILRFVVLDQPCACSVNYVGISSMPPHFGFMLSLPEIIELEEKREEKRTIYESPDFKLAEICIGKGTDDERKYELDIVDCSDHGIGILIGEKNFSLIRRIKVGDLLKGINFYASNAMLRIDGTVRHITKINDGKFKGSYHVGIESKDVIQSPKDKK